MGVGGPRRASIARLAVVAAAACVAFPCGAAAHGKVVQVSDTSGKAPARCPAIDTSDRQDVRGGCKAEIDDARVSLSVLTMFGTLPFADCFAIHSMHLSSSGRVVFDISIAGKTPCNDIRACTGVDDGGTPRWEGRLERTAGGDLHTHLGACLDTCMGQFKGRLTVALRPDGDRWRGAATRQEVGTSGFQFDGRWRSGPARFAPTDSVALATAATGRKRSP